MDSNVSLDIIIMYFHAMALSFTLLSLLFRVFVSGGWQNHQMINIGIIL